MRDILKCVHIITHFKNEEQSCDLLLKKWHIVNELVHDLKVLYQATVVIQKEDITLSDFYATWTYIQIKLTKYSRKQNYTSIAKLLLDALEKRKSSLLENPSMACAVILDPRFCKELNVQQKDIAIASLKSLWQRMKMVSNQRLNETSNRSFVDMETSTDEDISINNATMLNQYLLKKKQVEVDTQNSTNNFSSTFEEVISSLNCFVSMEHVMPKTNVINFWKDNKATFPDLYELSQIIYSIAPTQAVVERAFSTLAYVFNNRRNPMNPQMLEDILTICLNEELFHQVNEDDLRSIKG